jgi:hypothetical protein
MKKLITFIGALVISSAAFTQTNSIEGKWSQTGFSNTLKIYENGLIYTYYCMGGNCDSLYNTYEAADGNHIPGIEGYTLQNGILTIDNNLIDNNPGFALGSVTFSCEGNIYHLVTSVAEATYVRLNTNVNDCLSASINENDQNNLTQIYPNPAVSELNLLGEGAFSYQISDMSGKILLQGEVNESDKIRIADLNAGVYNITCITENKIQTLRFIKQ